MTSNTSKKQPLSVTHPDLSNEWNYDKNNELKPSDVTLGSMKNVWWKCDKGHEWQDTVNHRTRGRSCPYCSNHRILVGFNDLATTYPDLVNEWDYDRNAPLTPNDVTAGSNKKVWWVCSKGHSYDLTIEARTIQNQKCPYCSNHRVLVGFNDLQTTHPQLANEWHPIKNGNLSPIQVTAGSHKKVWWLGKCGHEWDAVIKNRTSNDTGCRYCNSTSEVLVGVNDLATVRPDLAEEWNYEKNQGLTDKNGRDTSTPDKVTVKSGQKVWWLGKCGHEWKATIANRVNGSGCSICNKEMKTSFSEQAIFYYLHKYLPDTINGDVDTIGVELDIYIPSLKTAIEYDGSQWHHKEYKLEVDKKKNEECLKHNIRLIRVQEADGKYKPVKYDDCICIERNNYRSYEELTEIIKQILRIIDHTLLVDVNVIRDEQVIRSLYVINRKERSLATLYPDIAKEWHPTKNRSLRPDQVLPHSMQKVWWMCNYGHEWHTTVDSRTNGRRCPYCSNRYLLVGFNDLASKYPEIAEEWHPIKNGDLKPCDVLYGTHKKVWWLCKCGHEWRASVGSRTSGSGCSYCKHKNTGKLLGKSVLCVETDKIYNSIAEAQKEIKDTHISECCLGKRKTAGGYHWKYVD